MGPSSSHDRTMRVTSRSVLSGQPPAPLAGHRPRGPRAGRASRDVVGIEPSRRGRRGPRRPRRAAGRGSDGGPPLPDGRWKVGESHALAGRDRRPSSGPPRPPARRPGGGGDWASNGVSGVPRCSRRARGAGTARRQSAPGRGAEEGPARWRAAPAASRPRQGRRRAGSCAPPRGGGHPRRRRGSRRPPRLRVAPVRSARYPRLFRVAAPGLFGHSHGMCAVAVRATQSSQKASAAARRVGVPPRGLGDPPAVG